MAQVIIFRLFIYYLLVFMLLVVFTGQGSQFVGMGKSFTAFPEMRKKMEEMDEALSKPLSQCMLDGDPTELLITENAQPAIACVSSGIWDILRARFDFSVDMLAGHSAGEYAALYAAESITWTDTAKILQIRGRAMQAACPVGYGGMAAVLGLTSDQIEKILQDANLECYIANDNGGQQIVISGEKNALSHAIKLAKAAGAMRVVELNVSAPFHTPLIKNAEIALARALGAANIIQPKYDVISNVTAQPYDDPADIRRLLIRQITNPVRWSDTITYAISRGVTHCIECGPAPVLSKLAKRIANMMSYNLETISVCGEDDLKRFEQYIESLGALHSS